MSKITIKDLGLDLFSKNIKRFVKKLDELSEIEKNLNIDGFKVIIKPVKKKD